MYAAPLIIVAIVLKIVVAMHKSCPTSAWIYHSGSCYLIQDDEPFLSWSDNRKMCQSLGGDLVLPRSQEENDFVFHKLLEGWPIHFTANVWIRCYFKDNKWDCFDDTNYAFWTTDLDKWGDCGMMRVNALGEWRGMPCHELRRFVCQAPAVTHARAVACSAIPPDQPRCLTNHTVTELAIKIPMQCCLACRQNPACRSFNLKGDVCQLNGVTAAQVTDEYFTVVPDCIYYEYE